MDALGSAGLVLDNLSLTQNRLATDVHSLASGLRVNSAVDDPSGYAIAATIQSKVNGLQQSVTNVQTAGNLLDVASGAINSATLILQRIRSLIVESNSDVNSSSDLQDIQTEINQLLLEINKIGSTTEFNGLKLLDGTYDTSQATQASVEQVTPPFLSPDGSSGSPNVANANGAGSPPGPLITNPVVPSSGYFNPALMVFQVTGYSDNAIDPDSGTDVGPGVYIQFTAYSTASGFGAAPLYQDTSAVPINAGAISGAQYVTPNGSSILLEFGLANLTANDVGATIAFQTTDATPAAGGTQLTVNDGGQEGTTVGISLPTVDTNALGISDISVLAPEVVNDLNQVQGTSSSNNVTASLAEMQVDAALQTLTSAASQVGAQQAALQDDVTNNSTSIVNLTATASNITDANIGSTVTDYTQQQILTQVGTSVLAHLQTDASQLATLLISAFSV